MGAIDLEGLWKHAPYPQLMSVMLLLFWLAVFVTSLDFFMFVPFLRLPKFLAFMFCVFFGWIYFSMRLSFLIVSI